MEINKMTKLNESKTSLPITYLTNFVSRGWGEIGQLKEEIASIKKEFTNTSKIETCVQNLIDAYLVCVGQIEGMLDDKKYLDFPEEAGALKESVEEIKPELTAIDIIKDNVELQIDDEEVILKNEDSELILDVTEEESEILEDEFSDKDLEDDDFEELEDKKEKTKDSFEPFEYFCDFE